MLVSSRTRLVAGLVAIAVLSRLLPHPPNFAAVGAVGLFAGASLGDRRASLLVPLTAMFLSDLILGLSWMTLVIYTAMSFYVVAGWWAGNQIQPGRLMLASLLGSTSFFLITNLACWWSMYDHTLSGLVTCYLAAIPFFQNTLLGDFAFGGALFTALKLAELKFPSLRVPKTHEAFV